MRISHFILIIFLVNYSCNKTEFKENSSHLNSAQKSIEVGDVVDSLNDVKVYYNGSVGNVEGRNVSSDGYNIGLKYQCVEFVKRYYFEYLNHKMPNSYGHAKDFFATNISDGKMNPDRNLIQYSNPSQSKPKVDDLIIFDGTMWNKYGHVAIISKVGEKEIEIIQQNPGPNGNSRERLKLEFSNNRWKIKDSDVLGWLRKEGIERSP